MFITSALFCSVLLFILSPLSSASDVSESWWHWRHCLGGGSGCIKYAWSGQAGEVAAPAGEACGPSEQRGTLPTPHLPRLSGLLQGLHPECQQVKVPCVLQGVGLGPGEVCLSRRVTVVEKGNSCLSLCLEPNRVGLGNGQAPCSSHFCLCFPCHSFTHVGNLTVPLPRLCTPLLSVCSTSSLFWVFLHLCQSLSFFFFPPSFLASSLISISWTV